ncbi:MAG: cation diffusion facilitator family transporter, partial [Anaerolineales bacterium]
MLEKLIGLIAGFVIAVISRLQYLGIALLMGIESACIPLPSEIIMPFSGYLVYKGTLELWLVVLAGAVGCVLGSWVAYAVADWRPSLRFTYRMRSASILSAFVNGLILLVATGAIAWEAVHRFYQPEPVATGTVMIVAAAAVVINGASAWLLSRGSHDDLNMRGAFLHMLADAGVSVAVVVAALGIRLTGWQWLDPAVSLLISVVILIGTWRLVRDS